MIASSVTRDILTKSIDQALGYIEPRHIKIIRNTTTGINHPQQLCLDTRLSHIIEKLNTLRADKVQHFDPMGTLKNNTIDDCIKIIEELL